jgi:Zn-dependent protease
MILRNLDLLRQDPLTFALFLVVSLGALVLAITVHEFSHALAATRLGDNTPRSLGRLSLNPLVHLDPMGSLMLLFVGFGWGKPVPVNAGTFGRNALRNMSLVAFAGPVSNVLSAMVLAIPFRAGLVPWPFSVEAYLSGSTVAYFVGYALFTGILFNLVLAVFNLIPVAPLDGSKVLPALLPRGLGRSYHRLERWGPGILMAVIGMDLFFGARLLFRLLGPPINLLSGVVVGHPVF